MELPERNLILRRLQVCVGALAIVRHLFPARSFLIQTAGNRVARNAVHADRENVGRNGLLSDSAKKNVSTVTTLTRTRVCTVNTISRVTESLRSGTTKSSESKAEAAVFVAGRLLAKAGRIITFRLITIMTNPRRTERVGCSVLRATSHFTASRRWPIGEIALSPI